MFRETAAPETSSDIYHDFRDRLRELETTESGLFDKKIGDWKPEDWKGFYQRLEASRNVLNWGYVPNPSGGFWNAVLNWFHSQGCDPYMQIEQAPLCFKVGEVYENRREVRERFYRLLMERADPSLGLTPPERVVRGTYMTVAKVPRSVWLGSEDELLDLVEVVERLNRYESWLKSVVEDINDIKEGHS